MKLWKNALLAFLVTGFAHATAIAYSSTNAEPNPASVKLLEAEQKNSFRLFFNPIQQEKTTLMLKDLKGIVLWEASLNEAESFAKLVNMRNLPDGQYAVHVAGESGELIQPVTLEDNEVEFNPTEQVYYKYPVFVKNGDMVAVELLTKDKMKVKVSLTDVKGNVLYDDRVNVSSKLVQKLDINKLKVGTYMVYVETPYRTFSEQIDVE
ncbi:MAG: hypothetical protein AAF502_03920 [Bacteroidota bacterium]